MRPPDAWLSGSEGMKPIFGVGMHRRAAVKARQGQTDPGGEARYWLRRLGAGVVALVLAACGGGDAPQDLRRSPFTATTTEAYDRDDLYRFFAIAFGSAPGVTYLRQLLEAADAGLPMQQIVNIFTGKPAFLEAYPVSLSNEDFARQLVDNVVGASASASTKAEAVADIVAALSPPANWTRGDIVHASFKNLAKTPATDLKWAAMARKLANQVVYAKHFTETMKVDTVDPAELRAVVQPVTENSSVEASELSTLIQNAVQAALALSRNLAPLARATADRPEVLVGETVTLDGRASLDPDGGPLSYRWQLHTRPLGSAATLSSLASAQPAFVADVAGTYGATLVVNDGLADSTSLEVTVMATPLPTGVQERWTVAFSPSEADFPNPDRGFYSSANWDFLAALDPAAVRVARAAGQRLLMARVQLDPWRETDLPASLLALLDERFTQVRAAGMKVTLLFNYDFSAAGRDASADRIRSHLQQLKPVLAAHADVIPFMRAGFIGAWGEWHSSASGNSCTGRSGTVACAAAEANRLIVRDALLDNVPETTQIGIRFPADLMRWYPSPMQQRRLGLHNDCFLAGPTDTGTYRSARQRTYVQALSADTAFGGETCVNGQTPVRDTCADILAEGRQYHLAWLNADYAPSVIAGWRAQGCLPQVSAFMGYRLQLDALAHAGVAARGEQLAFDVDLRNVGWARFFTPRRLVVELRHRTTGAIWSSAAGDLRELPSQAASTSRIRVTLTVPAGADLGDHEVWLGVPDAFAATEGDARFAVRFANADSADGQQSWSSAQGRFRTGSSVWVR